ncbi:MAG: bifunctional aldolase/short-chain dehydrogenase [Chloroflexaceae bacterium]|nr:bifunctional aldolase/short-chain dehydrogenase [Chloroflexaceae bacterium]
MSLLAQRVYTSRLLGQNQALVLHGGGNTSVKIREHNIFGDEEELLYVKGSGWDLETIEAAGFAPVRMAHLLRLATLDRLSDTQMANELRVATVNPAAPAPSVEAILHAILPFTFVDHSHADAVVTLTNTPHGRDHVREVYGDSVVIIPYVMPGFELARVCADIYRRESTPHTVGMVLMNHGLFTFANTARESYEKHVELVTKAEAYLQSRNAWTIAMPSVEAAAEPQRNAIAALRKEVSSAAGVPMILTTHSDAACLAFARRPDLAQLALQGPATPDHVIRTKRVPLLGRDVAGYVQDYNAYFAEHAARSSQQLTMLDPAPRVLLDQELGLVTIGRTARDAGIAEDIYRHTMEIVQRATLLEAWQALPAADLFAVEYWDLEQAKLRRQGAPPPFAGEIALVTGAASGIGKACVESLLKRGAAVVGLDVNPAIETTFKRPDYLGLPCDITDEAVLAAALETAVRRFGGLDMVILNAGVFPSSKKIANLPLDEWQRVMKVNLDANLSLLRESHPLLKLAPRGGRVVAIASKNVPAPGPGAAAYSASKAALTQLARLAALEWGADGIRVNIMHPNAVFDTGIWTEELLQARAASYGMTVEEYKTNNVLHVEITSRDVAELAAELCGPAFARTTGAQIPIDGGNERVI